MPKVSGSVKMGTKLIRRYRHIIPCTCLRAGADTTDYSVVLEEFNTTFRGAAVTVSSHDKYKGLLVCMRFGCLGRKRVIAEYVPKLPVISWKDYVERKQKWLWNGALDHAIALAPVKKPLKKVKGTLPKWYKRGFKSGETSESHRRLVRLSLGARNAKGHLVVTQIEKPTNSQGIEYVLPPNFPRSKDVKKYKLPRESMRGDEGDTFFIPDNYPSQSEIKRRVIRD